MVYIWINNRRINILKKKTPSKTSDVVRPFIFTKDPLIMDLLQSFAKRSEQGMKEYNGTMGQAEKPLDVWIDDVIEELYDACVYLEKVKRIVRNLNIKK